MACATRGEAGEPVPGLAASGDLGAIHEAELHRAAMPEALRAAEPAGRVAQLYEHCLPNSLVRRWLEEMRALRPGTAYHAFDPADLGRDDADITDVVDASPVLAQREAAMAEHRSQASPFDGSAMTSAVRF